MSNIGNVFGNRGWIQSAIDRSRGKTRPGSRERRRVSRDRELRRESLRKDPLFQKYGSEKDIQSMDYIGYKPRGLAAIKSSILPKSNNGKSRPLNGMY